MLVAPESDRCIAVLRAVPEHPPRGALAWANVRAHYEPNDPATRVHLRAALSTARQAPNESGSDYIARLETLRLRLRDAGGELVSDAAFASQLHSRL